MQSIKKPSFLYLLASIGCLIEQCNAPSSSKAHAVSENARKYDEIKKKQNDLRDLFDSTSDDLLPVAKKCIVPDMDIETPFKKAFSILFYCHLPETEKMVRELNEAGIELANFDYYSHAELKCSDVFGYIWHLCLNWYRGRTPDNIGRKLRDVKSRWSVVLDDNIQEMVDQNEEMEIAAESHGDLGSLKRDALATVGATRQKLLEMKKLVADIIEMYEELI